MALLKEIVPKLRRVAVLRDPATPASLKEIESAARSLGVQLQIVDWDGSDGAFRAMVRQRAEAVIIAGPAVFYDQRRRLTELALTHRIPSVHEGRDYVEAGGLVSYGTSITGAWERAAVFVDKILKGAKPADLPVEQSTRFELVINLKNREGARAAGPAVRAGAGG